MSRWPLSKLRQYLHYHGDALYSREYLVLIRWYGLVTGERLSYENIGRMFDITRSRVAQIRITAEWKLEREQELWQEDERLARIRLRRVGGALKSALELEERGAA